MKPTIYLSTLSALFVGGYAAQLRVQLTCISGILARLKGVVERSRYLPCLLQNLGLFEIAPRELRNKVISV